MSSVVFFCLFGVISAPETLDTSVSESDAWVNRWALSYGVSNVYPKLKLSERLVDRRVNDLLGTIIPDWKRPTTFEDWRDEGKLWDLHVGMGRDINRYASWFVNTAFSKGTIHNREGYNSYLVPISTHLDFDRWLVGGIVGGDLYPFAKPPNPCASSGNRILASLKSSRPFFKVAIGFTHTVGTGHIRVGIPKTPLRYRTKEVVADDFFYYSPRLGVEIPITANDSLLFDAGYLLVPTPNDEYNGMTYYFAHRHKFGPAVKKRLPIGR